MLFAKDSCQEHISPPNIVCLMKISLVIFQIKSIFRQSHPDLKQPIILSEVINMVHLVIGVLCRIMLTSQFVGY